MYRDRSQKEARDKLYTYGLITLVVDELLSELIQENFINEERFARAYVRGKFRIKKWGRNKIKQGLFTHRLSDYVLKKAFSEIDDQEYINTLEKICAKKRSEIKLKNEFQKNGKLAQWLISRGYESDLVWDLIKQS